MRISYIVRRDGERDAVKTYEVDEFPWEELPPLFIKCNRKKGNYISRYIAAFDIETTTIEKRDAKGELTERPYGFMYHWQMAVGVTSPIVVTGRTWPEWVTFMSRMTDQLGIDETHNLMCYIHNAGYEFQFIRDYLTEHFGGFTVFASQERKPITIKTGSGIHFKCSYKLSNMSLSKATLNEKGVEHPKADGDLDYRKIRTPSTPLDDTEFGYCVSDVVSLFEYIRQVMVNEGDNLESIPLTNTGYIRRTCRNSCRKDPHYREDFQKMTMSEKVYGLLKDAARGGDTHANRYMAGYIQKDIDSYDAQSDYPAQMCMQKFPMAKFTPYGDVKTRAELDSLVNDYPCLFRAMFTNLRVKPETAMPYASASKCQALSKGHKEDNGRVLDTRVKGEIGYAVLTLTDIDWKIIDSQYTWDDVYISDMHISEYGYLPECLLDVVRYYYTQKTVLKYKIEQIKGKKRKSRQDKYELANLEYLYAKSKNRLNSIFGMCFTDPVHDQVLIDEDGEWDTIEPEISAALAKYYNNRNSFLNYAWGVWVAAHARYHLFRLIRAAGEQSAIYCDTDSGKLINPDHGAIEKLNKEIMELAEQRKAYADVGGKRYYMGIFEKENDEPIPEFKTLGAKKYAYSDKEGLHVTVSGVGKKDGAKELGTIDNFKVGFEFTEAGGICLYYNDNEGIHYITVNGEKIETASNIGMVDSTYTLGYTKDYDTLLKEIGGILK